MPNWVVSILSKNLNKAKFRNKPKFSFWVLHIKITLMTLGVSRFENYCYIIEEERFFTRKI